MMMTTMQKLKKSTILVLLTFVTVFTRQQPHSPIVVGVIAQDMEGKDDINIKDKINDDEDVMYREQFEMYTYYSRQTGENEDDADLCNNISEINEDGSMRCPSSERVKSLLSSRAIAIEVVTVDDKDGIFGGFIGRFLNGLFRFVFRRSSNRASGYGVQTNMIVPVLSTHSDKFKSLSGFIQNEAINDSALSSKPEILQKMYALSAENMESVSLVFDTLVQDMEQHEMIDLTTLGCVFGQVASTLKDVTIPNIELMLMILSTKTNNPNMEAKYNEYLATKSTTFSTTGSKKVDTSCSDIISLTTRLTTSEDVTLRKISIGDILAGIDGDNVGIIQHLFNIVILIAFFPLSIVISAVVGILVLIGGFFYFLFTLIFGPPAPIVEDDDGIVSLPAILIAFAIIALAASVGAPIITIYFILVNIFGIFTDIFGPPETVPPMFPTPTWSPVAPFAPQPITPSSPTFIFEPSNRPFSTRAQNRTIPRDSANVNKMYKSVTSVLQSPIDTIFDMIQDTTAQDFYRLNDEENEERDCEMAVLICNSDALPDALTF